MAEEREAVAEILAKDDLVDTLAEDLQQALSQHESLRKMLVEERAIVAKFRRMSVEVSQELAGAGSDDHRTKNEVILRCVSRLLAISAISHPDTDDYGEIPF